MSTIRWYSILHQILSKNISESMISLFSHKRMNKNWHAHTNWLNLPMPIQLDNRFDKMKLFAFRIDSKVFTIFVNAITIFTNGQLINHWHRMQMSLLSSILRCYGVRAHLPIFSVCHFTNANRSFILLANRMEFASVSSISFFIVKYSIWWMFV